MMRIALYFIIISGFFWCCTTSKETLHVKPQEEALYQKKGNDTIRIADEESEYEITIIEPGFNFWLRGIARQKGYYSQNFLENRNRILVTEWNQRVIQPTRFNPNLYQMQIDYNSNIDYGYDVNYKLYNYFIYFQRKYKQRLGPFLPRI